MNKVGDARVGLVGKFATSRLPINILKTLLSVEELRGTLFAGFPSVGKSTLLNKLTGTFSEVGGYCML